MKSTDSNIDYRYSISGLIEKSKTNTSFSALLTDNFHLEPEVFIKGKQIGGKTFEPAAKQLAKSVINLLSNQVIMAVEVTGDNRLTPNAIMALAQIVPGEIATPEKIIAARVILENCGLFDQAQLYLTPSRAGRKLKISVKEKEMIVAAGMPGPGKKLLDNILGPPTIDLPEFPVRSGNDKKVYLTANSTGYLAFEADKILAEFSYPTEELNPERIENLVTVAGAIRNKIYSYEKANLDLSIILMKMCSFLDSESVRIITEKLQKDMENGSTDSNILEDTLNRIEFISQAYNAAQETQLILASRLIAKQIHSPITPWVLYSLGNQAMIAEEVTKAAPLLSGSISVSSLPVAPEMLLTTAKAQYSNLDKTLGDAAFELLRPLLAKPDLNANIRMQIKELAQSAALCKTATSISDTDPLDLQLVKGDALILLDRADLAEPLFHKLHSSHPSDARPLTGFARLAFQRTGNLLSARPYIERAEHMMHKDRFFYETALAYQMERIIGEALPTIQIDGRNSEEASATRFMLPKTLEYTEGYKEFNKPQAMLLEAGIEVLDNWLAYPDLEDRQALGAIFKRTSFLKEKMPQVPLIISANYYFSAYSPDREAAKIALCPPLEGTIGLQPRLLQLNMLIREMVTAPSPEIASALEYAASSTFSDARSRSKVVSMQADAYATLGIFHNSAKELEKANSLYELAIGLSNAGSTARLLNNQGCIALLLGKKVDADDLYDEALDSRPAYPDVVNLGKIMSSLTGEDLEKELVNLATRTKIDKVRLAATSKKTIKKSAKNSAEHISLMKTNITGKENGPAPMMDVLLKEHTLMKIDYNNYNGLQFIFEYESNPWLLTAPTNTILQD
ncbi:cyclic nucleotide-binding protein [Maridesulfovibrio zosterae]|uniref:cyclic nucleotide-binding protein n=1 Tax=Maridesulfovibrio zosterae TaxID=82171 RepID=UPI001FE0A917|nr:cyclic nucleotide-binding protein [Maridesulfovibrio zosterae]